MTDDTRRLRIEALKRERTSDLMALAMSKHFSDGDVETFVRTLIDEVVALEAAAVTPEGRQDWRSCERCGLRWLGPWTDCPGCTASAAALCVSELKSAEGRQELPRDVGIGGNHLASALHGLGMQPADWRGSTYDAVLERFGQPCADIWVAWKALMDWRDAGAEGRQTPETPKD